MLVSSSMPNVARLTLHTSWEKFITMEVFISLKVVLHRGVKVLGLSLAIIDLLAIILCSLLGRCGLVTLQILLGMSRRLQKK